MSDKKKSLLASVCCVAQVRVSINNSEDVPAQKKTLALMNSFPHRGRTDSLENNGSKRQTQDPSVKVSEMILQWTLLINSTVYEVNMNMNSFTSTYIYS